MGLIRILILHLAAIALFAQTDTGLLTGRVTDPSGAAIPGVAIKIRNLATTLQRETISDEQGSYQLNLLPPGLYEASTEAPGFRRFVDREVRIQVAQPTRLDIRLELGTVEESVEVAATASLLNTVSATQSATITQEKIEALPLNGRQFINLALLVPGTNGGGR